MAEKNIRFYLTKIRKSNILHIWPSLKIINMWDDLFYHLC